MLLPTKHVTYLPPYALSYPPTPSLCGVRYAHTVCSYIKHRTSPCLCPSPLPPAYAYELSGMDIVCAAIILLPFDYLSSCAFPIRCPVPCYAVPLCGV
eukprot:3243629-Rhodomonas_salina.1